MTILGTVIHGKGEGRTLGYPTANLSYATNAPPENGVWITRAVVDFHIQHGLTVVGMWSEKNLPSVEVFFLHIKEDLYNKKVALSLLKKVHDLQHFENTADLIKRIEDDVLEARKYFEH